MNKLRNNGLNNSSDKTHLCSECELINSYLNQTLIGSVFIFF